MCAARNPGYPQGLPLSPSGTGLTYARHLYLRDPRHGGGRLPVPSFEFEITENRRVYPRLPLQFPLRVRRVGSELPGIADSLFTHDISSTGAYFLAPISVQANMPVELEIGLTDRPRGRERVRMMALAHVVRVVPSERPGWQGVAVTFDEILFDRSDQAAASSN